MKFLSLAKKNKKNGSLPRIKTDAGRFCINDKSGAGFTMIELLVVILIVGILISIVLASMSNARNSAKDSSIQSALRELRNAAELHNDDNGTYEGICNDADNTLADDGGNFQKIEEYIAEYNGSSGELKCLDSEFGYAVISSLNLGGCWCVDYQGSARKIELDAGQTCSDKLEGITCP